MSQKEVIIAFNTLPNIGKALAEKLCFSGINSVNELMALGAKETFIKLLAFDKTACINQLYAIEGAIQGIRWHGLTKADKEELLAFYHSVKQS